MATVITSECINCGACEPECPNTAIYQGGVDWELNGVTHPAIGQDIFYIVPEKCTECVGFFDHEACAAVCPVDCCVPDPKIPEAEDALIVRARQLHPDTDFGAEFPSRFRKEGGSAGADAPAAEAPKAAAASAPAEAPKAAAASAPAAAPKAAAASAPAAGRAEKPLSPPRGASVAAPAARAPRKEKSFPAELPMTYEAARAGLESRLGGRSVFSKTLVFFAQPLLGALPFAQKKSIETAVGDARVFTAAGATGVNALQNMILYPAIAAAIGSAVSSHPLFSKQLTGIIVLGLTLAIIETCWRMREGFRAVPADEVVYRAAWYAPPLAALCMPLLRGFRRGDQEGTVAVDGFHGGAHEDKLERERRYGEVFSLKELGNGYLLTVEFPRLVPKSATKEELGIGDEMPDYDYDLTLRGNALVVKGSVVDPAVRKLAAVSPAFPPDFTTTVELPGPVAGFKHRFVGKTLEVALPKK